LIYKAQKKPDHRSDFARPLIGLHSKSRPARLWACQVIEKTFLTSFLQRPQKLIAKQPPTLPTKPATLAGIRRLFSLPKCQSKPNRARATAPAGFAEKTTHLARRRGGGTTARAKSKHAQVPKASKKMVGTVRIASAGGLIESGEDFG
jgi:hypothetical protein